MKRSPSLLRRIPPSPRTASVTSNPATPGGYTIPGGVELDELHVDHLRAGREGERVAVAGAVLGVRCDLVDAAAATGREYQCLGAEAELLAGRAPVAEAADDALAVLDQRRDRRLHEHVDVRVHGLVLERPNHLEAGAVSDVDQALVGVATERALRHQTVGRTVKDGAPVLELARAVRGLLGVQFGHPPVVEVLASEQRVLEVDTPTVRRDDVAERGGEAALGHDRVGLAQQ